MASSRNGSGWRAVARRSGVSAGPQGCPGVFGGNNSSTVTPLNITTFGSDHQQQSHSKPSGTASAVLSQAGGKSPTTTSRTGLKNLKWCRVSPVQNTTTVSSGGQPGRPQAISDTRIVASAASVKRSRVHSRTRASASWYAGLLFSSWTLVDAGIMLQPIKTAVSWIDKLRLSTP